MNWKKAVLSILALSSLCATSAFGQGKPPKQDHPQGPPPEAFAACEGKKAGDQAEFTGRQGESVTGVCEEKNGRLVLRPDHPPKAQEDASQEGQRPEPPPEAFAACKGKKEGDKAELTGRQGETVTGTCQRGKGDQLVLRPDHPPKGGGAGEPKQNGGKK
jgi:hypothetical protein